MLQTSAPVYAGESLMKIPHKLHISDAIWLERVQALTLWRALQMIHTVHPDNLLVLRPTSEGAMLVAGCRLMLMLVRNRKQVTPSSLLFPF